MRGIVKGRRSVVTASLLAVLLLAATALAAWAALGHFLTNISETSTDAGYPAVAVNGNSIGIAWSEQYPGGTALQGPIYLQGTTNGLNLAPRQVVDDSFSVNNQSWAPDIAADSTGRMHIVWKNLFQSTTHRLFYRPCNIGSNCLTQTKETIVSKPDPTEVDLPRLALGRTRGGIHVVWQEKGTGEGSIMYAGRVTTNSWSTPFALASVTLDEDLPPAAPAIAVTTDGVNDYVHVVWVNNASAKDIRYRRGTVPSTHNTVQSWGAVKSWPNPNSNLTKGYPAIAAAGSTVVVLWDVNTGATNEYYALYDVSTDHGANWPGPVKEMLTDQTLLANFTPIQSKVNGVHTRYTERLQIQAAFGPGSDVLHVVWHQSETNAELETVRHVFYSSHSGPWKRPAITGVISISSLILIRSPRPLGWGRPAGCTWSIWRAGKNFCLSCPIMNLTLFTTARAS